MVHLPRFLPSEGSPSDDPFRLAGLAWDEFITQFHRNNRGIHSIISTATTDMLFRPAQEGASHDEQAKITSIGIEEDLRENYPFFVVAADGLRQALDRLKGKAITWNHYERGDVVAQELSDFNSGESGDTYLYVLKRASATYPEESGYLVDHHIGSDAPMANLAGGYALWMEVNYVPDADTGINLPLEEMFAIRETITSD